MEEQTGIKHSSFIRSLADFNNYKGPLNEQDYLGQTILHRAVIYNLLDLIEMLLKKGANARLKNKMSKTPIFYATNQNKQKIIDLFIQNVGPCIYEDLDLQGNNFMAY